MTKEELNDKKRRLEFLNTEQRETNALLADNNLLAGRLASIVVEDKPKDAKSLTQTINDLEAEIENHKPVLVNQVENATNNMIGLGIRHKTEEIADDNVGIDASKYLSLQDEIAQRYMEDNIPEYIPGVPISFTEQEAKMVARTKGRLLDAVQDEIEVLFNRDKSIEGLGYMRHLQDKYGDQLGGAVNFPVEMYTRQLLSELKITQGELENSIMALDITSKPTTLSDRLWTFKEKSDVYRTVAQGIKENKTAFQIAEDLENVVVNDRPRYMIDRIANTELVRAYSKSKQYIAEQVVEEFPEFKVIVEIRLNALHPKPDICDLVEGDYNLEDAPIVPIHPNCICKRRERLVPASRRVRTNNMAGYIRSRKDIAEEKKIYIPKVVGEKPLT